VRCDRAARRSLAVAPQPQPGPAVDGESAGARAGHIERLLIQQEELFDATRGGVDKSLRVRFDAWVRAVNVSLCGAWEEAQEMIRRGVPARIFEVTQTPAVRYPHEKP